MQLLLFSNLELFSPHKCANWGQSLILHRRNLLHSFVSPWLELTCQDNYPVQQLFFSSWDWSSIAANFGLTLSSTGQGIFCPNKNKGLCLIKFFQLNFFQKFPNSFGGENWDKSGYFDTLPSSLGCEIFGNCLLSFPQNERI